MRRGIKKHQERSECQKKARPKARWVERVIPQKGELAAANRAASDVLLAA